MIFYTWYGTRFQGRNTPRFADSVYFMGFLWTLWALIDALVLHANVDSRTIFGVFGYALITTAFGMFLRLMLLQFQQTLPDQLINAREEIERDLLVFSSSLKKGAVDLNAFQHEAHATLLQWTAALTETTKELRKAIEDAYLTSVREHATHLGNVITQLAEELTRVQTNIAALRDEASSFVRQFRSAGTRFETASQKFSDTLQVSAITVEQAIQGVAGRIDQLNVPEDLISKKLDGLVSSLREDATNLRASLQATTKLIENELTEVLAALKNAPQKREFREIFEHYLETLRNLSEQCTTLVSKTAEVAGNTGVLKHDAEAAVAAMGGITVSADEVVKTLAKESEKLVQEVRDTGDKLARATGEVVNFIKTRLEERV